MIVAFCPTRKEPSKRMLQVHEAHDAVLGVAKPLRPVLTALSDLLRLVLAEDVASELDMPPYDKALVDGFAVRAADLPQGKGVLAIVAEIFAGETAAKK